MEINAFNYAYAVINKYYASCCFILKVKLNATISKKKSLIVILNLVQNLVD